MLGVYWIGAFYLLFPIVAVEGALFHYLAGHPWKPSLVGSLGANLASTAVGLPLVWGVFFLIQALSPGPPSADLWSLVRTAAWLPPMSNSEYAHRLPTAALVLWAPFMLASVAIEALVMKRIVDTRFRVWAWSWLANSATYGAVACYFVWALYHP
jgi:hypothetical protein